ncbi:MAG: stem cell self-renewal protein Piwi domain-containing protein, partial [Cyanobacteria bacterium J06621_11]
MSEFTTICLNRFSVKALTEKDRKVYQYAYSFTDPPEGADIYRAVGRILYGIGSVTGVRLKSTIVTTKQIPNNQLRSDEWALN